MKPTMKIRFLATRLCVLLAATLLLTAAVYGQAMDSILVGTVTDASGAAVPNTTVTALNTATGVKYTATTNSAGEYRLNNLPIGKYDVSGAAKGFAAAKTTGVALDLNHTATVNLTLPVGELSQTVEVTAAAALIDTSSAQLSTTYTTNIAEDMGIAATSKVVNGSGIWNLSLLGAGVRRPVALGQAQAPALPASGRRTTRSTSMAW